MTEQRLRISRRDDLPRGGFAGVRETRVVAPTEGASRGLGSMVYLADAEFVPGGETGLHPHRDIDIVSVMLRGEVAHQGSLGDGTRLGELSVQVQRAGSGMVHNEINPHDLPNRMLQIWFLPPRRGLEPGYQVFRLQRGAVTTVLGDKEDTFDNASRLEAALLTTGQELHRDGRFLAYLAGGSGTVGGEKVEEGALMEGENFDFRAESEAELMIVTMNE